MRLLATRLTAIASAVKRLFSPASLFRNSEQGVWYDPSDLSTLFQDSAGTTPVTAVEQPVGKILDKSGRGNHATQATAASRPVLSARVNLLTKSEDFSDAVWAKFNTTITPNAVVAPDGTTTAYTLTAISGGYPSTFATTTVISDTSHTLSIFAKSGTNNKCSLEFRGVTTAPNATFNLDLGTVISGTGTISAVGNGWYKCSVTKTSVDTSELAIIGMGNATPTGSIYIWGAQLETGSTATRYQRVNTATDYDTVGFPTYLKFDGIDDSLATASTVDFTATDKMTVFAGVRKLSDAARGIVVELSATTVSNAFNLSAPGTALAPDYFLVGRGNEGINIAATITGFAAPVTSIVTGTLDIAAQTARIRVNSGSYTTGTATGVTGNFGNYPIYIGRRGGTDYPFNGHLYSLIIRGAQSSDSQIASAESYVNSKTGAY